MRLFNTASPRQLDLGLLVMRLAAGLVFMMHGGQKLFVYGFQGVTGAFSGMGVPFADIVGPGVALLEFVGGLALIAGLATRLVGLGLALVMLGALFTVHLAAGFFLPNGYEFVFTLFAISAGLMFTGAGALSVDALIARRLSHRGVPRGETVDRSLPVGAQRTA
ncbi:MAG: DoxX family protein [Gemmatimonadota bacterium]